MFFYSLNPLYFVLVGPAMVIALAASIRVKTVFAEYSRRPNRRGVTGAQAAHAVLRAAGIGGVEIEEHRGFLSDHYDPTKKVLRLSSDVYHGRSIAALGVAAHEAGHAVQDATSYAPLGLRSAIVPLASLGSWMSFPLIFLGVALGAFSMVKLGILAFGAVVLFQLVTLPVEFDASARAKRILAETGLTATPEEAEGVRIVLSAAAMTYVAATLTAVMELLYFVLVYAQQER